MDVVKVEDQVLLTRRDGDRSAPPLVCVNALGTDLRVWDRLTPYLVDRFHVVRFDLRGQGLSTLGDGPLELDRLAADLASLMDQLDTGPAVVAGVELGALVALTLSRVRPELAAGLALIGGACRLDTAAGWRERARRVEAAGLADVADATLAQWLPDTFRSRRPDEARIWRNMLVRSSPAGYVAGCRALAEGDATAAATAVHVPSLVVTGDRSSPARRDAAAVLAATIPTAETAPIRDAALLAQVTQPGPLAAAMLAFVEHHGLG
jgi:3-oxoadipate enol-lactonase